jgi:hypothetical protein
MLGSAWIGVGTFLLYFLLWGMAYWCVIAYYYWLYRGEVISENKSDHIFVCFYSYSVTCYFCWFRPLFRFPVELQDTTSLEWFTGSLFMVTEAVLLQILICSVHYIYLIWLQVHRQNVSCSWTFYTSVDSWSSSMVSIWGIVYTWLVHCAPIFDTR